MHVCILLHLFLTISRTEIKQKNIHCMVMQKPLDYLKILYLSSSFGSKKSGQFSVLILPDISVEHLTKWTPSFILLPEYHVRLVFLLAPWLCHLCVSHLCLFFLCCSTSQHWGDQDLISGPHLYTHFPKFPTCIYNCLVSISACISNRHSH